MTDQCRRYIGRSRCALGHGHAGRCCTDAQVVAAAIVAQRLDDTEISEAMMRRALADVIALRDELAADRSIVSNAFAARIDHALKGQRRAADQ